MFEWSEEHAMVRDAVRQFVDNEIRPHREELEFGDVPPYAVLRKMFETFGMRDLAIMQFEARIAKEKAREGEPQKERKPRAGPEALNEAAMRAIPIIELCKYSPGIVTAL